MTARIDVVGLVTSDPARTVSFYRALGCEVPALTENGHLDLALGEVTLMIDTETVMTSFDPRWAQGSAGRLSLAAHCDTPDEVDHLHKVLRQLGSGSQLEPFDAPWGQRYASVLDPDGIRIDLYASLPGLGAT
ncbi:MAG TPA: VOC family protein [Microlunatus sp.]|jgi:catechol 2,3-dioxygenase-like lactoylglutathione lyase family enzyme|nr:VOC family protein [Microlunatus sp.]